MNYFTNSYVRFSFKLVFTVCVLTIIFKSVPFNDVVFTISHTHIQWLILGTIFFILSKYFSSIRLYLFFKNAKKQIDSVYNMKLYILGMFYNFFLPTGIGGDAYKVIKIHNDYSYPIKNIATILLLDRLSGLVALINLAVLCSLYFISAVQGITLFIILVLGNIIYPFIIRKYIAIHIISLQTELLSLLVQLSQCVCAFCILRAIDIATNQLIYIVVFLISSVASLFPLSIGGLGAREYTFMLAATHFNLHIEKAISIGFLFYIISLFVSSFGSYFIFKPINSLKTHA